MAILLGTIVGGMAAKGGGDPSLSPALMLVFALLCWGSSLLIPKVGSGAPDLKISANIARSTGRLLRHLRDDRRLWWGALVTSWFWLVGAVVLSLLPPLVKTVLGGTEEVVTMFLAVFSVASRWARVSRRGSRPAASSSCRLSLAQSGSHASRSTSAGPPTIRRWRRAGRRRRGVRIDPGLRVMSISPALPSPAAFTSCRPLPRCRPGPAPTAAPASSPASTCSTPPSWSVAPSCRGAAGVPCFNAGAVHPDRRSPTFGVAVLVGAPCRPTRCMDFLSILFRVLYRVELRASRTSTAPAKIRSSRSTTRISSTVAGVVAAAEGPGVRHRQRHGAALVGQAVPALHPRHAARSDQADGDAHADQRGQIGRAADHLSRRAPHRHRQPDEGL